MVVGENQRWRHRFHKIIPDQSAERGRLTLILVPFGPLITLQVPPIEAAFSAIALNPVPEFLCAVSNPCPVSVTVKIRLPFCAASATVASFSPECRIIFEIHSFPKQFAIVDGIVGREGNGPIQGTPKAAGVLVAGRHPVAIDATCCRVKGIDPKKIEHLQLARGEANLGEAAFRQTGENIRSVRTDFALVDQWKQIRAIS